MILKTLYKWDNFFDPDELELVMSEARESNYNVKAAAYMGYAANHSCSEEVLDLIISKLCCKFDFLFHAKDGVPLAEFRMARENDRSKFEFPLHTDGSDVFWDRNLVALCIPLSDSPDYREPQGLDFYKNKLFGSHSYLQLNGAEAKKLEWEKYASVNYKKNQAILFHSCMFHSPRPNHGYGNDVFDARLTLQGFFRLGYNEKAHVEGFDLEFKEI